jgi:hypothetical protein
MIDICFSALKLLFSFYLFNIKHSTYKRLDIWLISQQSQIKSLVFHYETSFLKVCHWFFLSSLIYEITVNAILMTHFAEKGGHMITKTFACIETRKVVDPTMYRKSQVWKQRDGCNEKLCPSIICTSWVKVRTKRDFYLDLTSSTSLQLPCSLCRNF